MKLKERISILFKTIKLLFKYYKTHMIYITILSVMQAVFPLITIYVTARIIDAIVMKMATDTIIFWATVSVVSIFIINIIQKTFSALSEREYSKIFESYLKIWNDIYNDLDYQMIEDPAVISKKENIDKIFNFTGRGMLWIIYVLNDFIKSILLIIGSIFLTVQFFYEKLPTTSPYYYLNTTLSNISFIAILIILSIIIIYIQWKIRSAWSRMLSEGTKGNSIFGFYMFYINEKKRAIDVRLFNQDRIGKETVKESDTFLPGGILDRIHLNVISKYSAIENFVNKIQMSIIYIFVIIKAYEGVISIGMLSQYIGSILQLTSSFVLFASTIADMLINSEFTKSTFEFIENNESMYQGSLTTEKRDDNKYEIEFKNVSFKYPNTNNWALKDVNVKFELGKKLAIVGQNGSGKTTFIKLLIRLYDPNEGQILLNGIDIRKYKYEDYLKIFSVVFQDFNLFAFPIAQNIAGSIDYDRKKVEGVIEDVGMTERISEMKDGVDTYIYKDNDTEGVDLSGGEEQKIAIARALYKKAAFIILDEPTAALDPLTEQEIYEKMSNIVKDKTAIFISHRLSSCKLSDNILVFDKGSIIQEGAHNKLVNEAGKYKELWDAQAGYYI
ncbi:ABC transporter ATP-binding protein [Helcococcus kunzii]|uniref:ABC transporter ATP-binding protein n=1 Tax=Helcococcus kunzii TaxID=40091 RepID=UPI0021A5E342|nr:ABC transporter ATP-binding protein [Helcococcus kunzii]MCT1796348.1 ABC transporter ATP-binding protein/permease [Helcococcus kunzii]MCT1989018.1 ABC transporter ATP-binding protein/permease [Helcococcus kunzii]